jgi:hypothetical protein
LFRLMHSRFVKRNSREPKNVSRNYQMGLEKDRVFALTFFFVSIFTSIGIIAIMLWGVDKK